MPAAAIIGRSLTPSCERITMPAVTSSTMSATASAMRSAPINAQGFEASRHICGARFVGGLPECHADERFDLQGMLIPDQARARSKA